MRKCPLIYAKISYKLRKCNFPTLTFSSAPSSRCVFCCCSLNRRMWFCCSCARRCTSCVRLSSDDVTTSTWSNSCFLSFKTTQQSHHITLNEGHVISEGQGQLTRRAASRHSSNQWIFVWSESSWPRFAVTSRCISPATTTATKHSNYHWYLLCFTLRHLQKRERRDHLFCQHFP